MATRKENGKRNTRARYSFEFKLQSLELLRAYGMVFNRAAAELGISCNTLRAWYSLHGEGWDQARRQEEIAQRFASEMVTRERELLPMIQELKLLIIKRMFTLVPNERDLSKLASALAVLYEIRGTESSGCSNEDRSITLIEKLTQTFVHESPAADFQDSENT